MSDYEKDALYAVGGVLVLLFIFAVFGYAFGQQEHNRSEIGDEKVPHGLSCTEDEVIGYDPLDVSGPRPLTCVHIDNFNDAK